MTLSTAGMTRTTARPRPYGAAARPRVRNQCIVTPRLDLLGLVPAQQATRPHHEHEHDEGEGDGVAKLRHFEPDDAVDDAEQQSADDGACEAGESADHGRGKCLERDVAHHAGVEVVDRRDQHARHRAHRGTHSPAEGIHPTDTDAHQLCRYAVLRDGPHRDPRWAEAEERKEEGHQHQRHQEDQRVQLAHDDRPEVERWADHWVGKGPYLVAPDPTRSTEQDEAQADRDDHRVQDGGRVDAAQHDALDQRAEESSEEHGQGECEGEREPERCQERERYECAEHRCLALSKGDDLRRLEDQDDAERGQCVQAAEREPVHQELSPGQIERHTLNIRMARSAKSSAIAASVSRPFGRYQRWTQVHIPRRARAASLGSVPTNEPSRMPSLMTRSNRSRIVRCSACTRRSAAGGRACSSRRYTRTESRFLRTPSTYAWTITRSWSVHVPVPYVMARISPKT